MRKKSLKIISVAVLLVLVFTISGCASKEDKEAASNMDTYISDVAENGGDIADLIASYDALTEDQKKLLKQKDKYEEVVVSSTDSLIDEVYNNGGDIDKLSNTLKLLTNDQKSALKNTDKYDKIIAANEVLLLVDTSKIPSQSEFDNILSKYNDLDSSQKKMIKIDDYIEKYRDIDINKAVAVNEKVETIKEDATYSDVKDIITEYNSLSDKEKKIISNGSKIEELASLSEWDKAGIAAARFVKTLLKDSNSFELISSRVVNSGGFYFVTVYYSGKNGFGGTQKEAICIDVNSNFEPAFVTLSLLTGTLDKITANNYQEFVKHNTEAIELDVDKIMDNIDANVSEK